jgi:L-asparaginase/Glu-tRNA(Gln) amidotransferase subunit D
MTEITALQRCDPYTCWQDAYAVFAGGTITSRKTNNGRAAGSVERLIQAINRYSAESNYFDRDLLGNLCTLLKSSNSREAYIGLSENLNERNLQDIKRDIEFALNENKKLILVTCGTDAMEQVAKYIDKELGNLAKEKKAKVIFTGANHDYDDLYFDGGRNVVFAYSEGSKIETQPGAYIAFEERLIPASEAVKEPFITAEPFNKYPFMRYDSINSSEYDRRKTYQDVTSAVMIDNLEQVLHITEKESSAVIDYPVNVIRKDHEDFLKQITPETRAVLFTLYHSGTANADENNPDASVALLAKKLREKNIVPFAVSENGELVTLRAYETSTKLKEEGVVSLCDMQKEVALAKLRMAVQLAEIKTSSNLIDFMLTDVAHEINDGYVDVLDLEKLKKLYRV